MITAFIEFLKIAVGRVWVGLVVFFSVMFVTEGMLLAHPWPHVDLLMQLITKTIAATVTASTCIIAIALARCIAKSKVRPIIKTIIKQIKKSA